MWCLETLSVDSFFMVSSALEAYLIMNGLRDDYFQAAGVVFFCFAVFSV